MPILKNVLSLIFSFSIIASDTFFNLVTDVTPAFQNPAAYRGDPSFRQKQESGNIRWFRILTFVGMTIWRNISW